MTPAAIPTDELVAARNKANYEQGILDGLLKQLISNGTQRGALNARIDAQYPTVDAAKAAVRALEEVV